MDGHSPSINLFISSPAKTCTRRITIFVHSFGKKFNLSRFVPKICRETFLSVTRVEEEEFSFAERNAV